MKDLKFKEPILVTRPLLPPIEEYEKRLKDPTVKGKAQKRVKTFKVDAANIDMDYLCTAVIVRDNNGPVQIKVPFLYFILNTYFSHKDLLNEYFEAVLGQS